MRIKRVSFVDMKKQEVMEITNSPAFQTLFNNTLSSSLFKYDKQSGNPYMKHSYRIGTDLMVYHDVDDDDKVR
jgi:hypothetical protein